MQVDELIVQPLIIAVYQLVNLSTTRQLAEPTSIMH